MRPALSRVGHHFLQLKLEPKQRSEMIKVKQKRMEYTNTCNKLAGFYHSMTAALKALCRRDSRYRDSPTIIREVAADLQ